MRKIPIKVSPDGRYLIDDEGNPFFHLANTAWALFYKTTREEADLYLQNRKEKSFTVVMPVLLRKKDTTARNVYGNMPLVDWDPTQPNEAFFEYVDYVPHNMRVCINMDIIAGGTIVAKWFNPKSGAYRFISEYANSGIEGFQPPEDDVDPDYVLVLEAA